MDQLLDGLREAKLAHLGRRLDDELKHRHQPRALVVDVAGLGLRPEWRFAREEFM